MKSGILLSFDERDCWESVSIDDPELECEARAFRGEALLSVLPTDRRERRGLVTVIAVRSDIAAASDIDAMKRAKGVAVVIDASLAEKIAEMDVLGS